MASVQENKKLAEDVKESMDKRLKAYQKKSVEAICKHFDSDAKEYRRVLLADEVGLGKTEIAKGVVSYLVEKHWNTEGQTKPFKVAYICPNQSVAQQNIPKFRDLYGSNVDGVLTKEQVKGIEEALRIYRDTINQLSSVKSDKRQQGEDWGYVYIRVWQWLLRLYDGKNIREAIGDELCQFYLPSEDDCSKNKEKGSQEWSSNEKDIKLRKKVIGAVEVVTRQCFEEIKNTDFGIRLIAVALQKGIISVSGYNVCVEMCASKERLPRRFYDFNKAVALLLAGQEEFRLSMQHLAMAEAEKGNVDNVIQFEALTPKTSFSSNRKGTYQERACVGATYDIIHKCARYVQDPKNPKAEGYADAYALYKARIINVNGAAGITLKAEEIEGLIEELMEVNAEKLEYDLVIMDEFQNYTKLLYCDGGKSEEFEIAKALFEKKKCRILMLSATPFPLSEYVPMQIYDDAEENGLDERGVSEAKDALERFFMLLAFLSGKTVEECRDAWNSANSTKKQEELLMSYGLFRTERQAASKYNPVKRFCNQVENPDYRYALRAQRLTSEQEIENWRADYGHTTPFAMTFAGTYSCNKDNVLEERLDGSACGYLDKIFINKGQLEGYESIETENASFEELRKSIFGEDGFTPATMLWIPPSKAGEEDLRGAFKGRHGFSKRLIFAHFRMSPMALTYLLCHEAKCRLGVSEKITESKKENVRSVLADKVKSTIEKVMGTEQGERIAKELLDLSCSLFCGPDGVSAVRSVYPSKEEPVYEIAVEKYCEDGCFCLMLEEYLELLKNECGNNEIRMARAIKRLKTLRKATPKLLLWDEQKNCVSACEKAPDNLFAVGLFAEKQNADTTARMNNLKGAFNSPFWPFVLTTTSIGTEGIDLHWYARHILHWAVPSRALDIEQREGRVLRYQCHAIRLNQALLERQKRKQDGERLSLKEQWQGSGLYDCQLDFFSDTEKNGETDDGCYHVTSETFFEPGSIEAFSYKEQLRIVQAYRLLLGCADEKAMGEILKAVDDDMQKNSICLAPYVYDSQKRAGGR